jgi:hypothetical protein
MSLRTWEKIPNAARISPNGVEVHDSREIARRAKTIRSYQPSPRRSALHSRRDCVPAIDFEPLCVNTEDSRMRDPPRTVSRVGENRRRLEPELTVYRTKQKCEG